MSGFGRTVRPVARVHRARQQSDHVGRQYDGPRSVLDRSADEKLGHAPFTHQVDLKPPQAAGGGDVGEPDGGVGRYPQQASGRLSGSPHGDLALGVRT